MNRKLSSNAYRRHAQDFIVWLDASAERSASALSLEGVITDPFRTLAPARALLEERLGPPPAGIGRVSWALVQRTVEGGQWPQGKAEGSFGGPSRDTLRHGEALAATQQRIILHLERMEQRLERLELLLLHLLDRQAGPPTFPPTSSSPPT